MIKKEDIRIIEEIADKYEMTFDEFVSLLAKKNKKYKRTQILFSDEEKEIVDSKAAELSLNRSSYCTLCFKKAIETEAYKNINIVDALCRNTKRTHRATISYVGIEGYDQIEKTCKELGLPISTMIRYFALNIDL